MATRFQPTHPDLYTLEETAALLGVSPRTLRAKRAAGDGSAPNAIHLGGQLVWRRRDVDEWLDALPVHTGRPPRSTGGFGE
jgi:predicted DNA-binding transcriptional regulator AlpA